MRNPSQLLIITDSIDDHIAHTEPLVLLNCIHIGEDRQVSELEQWLKFFILSKGSKILLSITVRRNTCHQQSLATYLHT